MDTSVDHKNPPVPRPRTASSTSRIPTAIRRKTGKEPSGTSERDEPRESFLHVVEVHSVKSAKSTARELSTSDERAVEPIEGKKRKKVVRKRSTFVVKKPQNSDGASDDTFKKPLPVERKRGSATETLSDNSSPTRIQIGPLVDRSRRKRQPKGSATETLSEDSSPSHNPLPTPDTSPKLDRKTMPPQPPPRSSVKCEKPSPKPRRSDLIDEHNSNYRASPRQSVNSESPSCYTSSSIDYQDTGVIPTSRQKKHKKKRKFKEENDMPNDAPTNESPAEQVTSRQVICLTIHRCEPLKMRDMYKRPSVRVHFLDTKTKQIMKSSEGKTDVETLETQAFDPIVHRTLVPTWDEELLLNEPPENIASPDCLVIFEILEMETNDLIAWAFLRPVSANGKSNLEKQLRLQLYKVAPLKKFDKNSLPKPFQWWVKGKLKPYKSTLFVSVSPVPAELFNNKTVKEAESSHLSRRNSNFSRISSMKTRTMTEEKDQVSEADLEILNVIWSRMPSLTCKLPNKIDKQVSVGSDGGICLSYSHSGLLLACHTTSSMTVLTYKGTPYLNLTGHYGLVYGMDWSSDDSLLCTASADATACIWDIKSKLTTPVLKLPHPSYVYCCSWIDHNRVITGCFDGGVRLWNCFTGPASYVCDSPEELGHKTRVNSLARMLKPFSSDGYTTDEENLVSGDSEGVLIFWKLAETEQNATKNLKLSRIVKLRELKQKNINKITCHPGGKRILVATRDNTLRMIDLKTTAVIQWFHGGVSQKVHLGTGSTFCGCGSRVLACSEDDRVLVWDANTGERLACYNQPSVQAIDFHPKENSFALLGYSVGCFPTLIIASHARGETTRGDFILQWPTDYKISSEVKSRFESSRRKKRSMLTTLLQHHTTGFNATKKGKKGVTNGSYTTTETPSENNSNKSSVNSSVQAVDSRLNEVIRKMDSILCDNSSECCSSSRVPTPASIK